MIREAVIIPALRAGVTFAFLSVFIIAVLIIAGITPHPFAWGFGLASVVSIGYWFYFLAEEDDTRKRLEKPMPVHHQLEVPFLYTQNGHEAVKLDNTDKEKWRRICGAIVDDNMQFSEAKMRRIGIKRAPYQELRKQMLDRGVMEWKNPREPRQGVRPTHSGAAFIRYHAR